MQKKHLTEAVGNELQSAVLKVVRNLNSGQSNAGARYTDTAQIMQAFHLEPQELAALYKLNVVGSDPSGSASMVLNTNKLKSLHSQLFPGEQSMKAPDQNKQLFNQRLGRRVPPPPAPKGPLPPPPARPSV